MLAALLLTQCAPPNAVSTAQDYDRWQQRVDYRMVIDMDVETHRYQGTQELRYTNNSPDTLDRVFYHLYFNAFQPGSMMDIRNRDLPKPDKSILRIGELQPEEQGYIRVERLSCNGREVEFEVSETILEVLLPAPILPGVTARLEMAWEAQTPLQIRRSGRDNSEGVAYSMSQWYPKLCEYDYQGWHANPYIAREFYGVWGDFDVTIHIDNNFVVAAGGVLQNPEQIGHGYDTAGMEVARPDGDRLTWHFRAENVHDFVWAADPGYTQSVITADDGTLMRFFWQEGQPYDTAWRALPPVMNRARTLMNERFGRYPYPEYAWIQGGDGGTEYPMATLITGDRDPQSLIRVAVHEQLHAWFHTVLANNESLYPWMDEGFTSYAEAVIMDELAREGLVPGMKPMDNPQMINFLGYNFVRNDSTVADALSTHADHYRTNNHYGYSAYFKGAVFLVYLEYIIGRENLSRGLRRYFETWKFKHPNPNDFIRVMEKESGLELDWFKEEFIQTINKVDYAIGSVRENGPQSIAVTIERRGETAMPLDILVTYENGEQTLFYAPLESMRGVKPAESDLPRVILPDHRWVDRTYSFEVPANKNDIVRIKFDPSNRLAGLELEQNTWERGK